VLPGLAPLGPPFVLLFMGGLVVAVAQSFGWWLPFEFAGGRLDGWREALSAHHLESLGFSLGVAFASAGLATCMGALGAYWVWLLPPRLARASMVYKIGLVLPHASVAFVTLLLWSQSGFFASLAHQLGLVSAPADFPSVLYGGWGAGMVLAFLFKETPFVMLLALSVLARTDRRLVETARMLGAGGARTFLLVVLPRLGPVLHTAFLILFLYTFGAFDIPYLLGESRPAMVAMRVYSLYFERDLANRPTAMALLVLMLLLAVAFIALYARASARLGAGERRL
jgi:putative spermidine/putrescine transport system permease protein